MGPRDDHPHIPLRHRAPNQSAEPSPPPKGPANSILTFPSRDPNMVTRRDERQTAPRPGLISGRISHDHRPLHPRHAQAYCPAVGD